MTTVCRFLALLELFREGAVTFEQLTPLGELTICWTGSTDGELEISDEFDRPAEDEPSDTAADADSEGMSDEDSAVHDSHDDQQSEAR